MDTLANRLVCMVVFSKGGCRLKSSIQPSHTTGRAGRIQDWSADSRVRAFLASDQVRADKAVRAPVWLFLPRTLSANSPASSASGPGPFLLPSSRTTDLLESAQPGGEEATRPPPDLVS